MKQFANGILVCFIALQLFAPSISGIGGDDDATAFVRQYTQGLGDGELEQLASRVESGDMTSMAVAKQFAEITTRKRQDASAATIDKALVEMSESEFDSQRAADWVRQCSQRWRQIGEAL